LQNRIISSAEERKKLYEEIREWYLENKPDYSPKKSWTEDVPKWILLPVLILVILPLSIIALPFALPLLVIGSVFLLISGRWGVAMALWALFLIFRFLSVIFKH